jgi:hypothetical protein
MSKTVAVFIVTIVLVIALHAFRAYQPSNIKGRIFSGNGEIHVLAIKGKDSVKTMSSDGQFSLKVKPGSWQVLIGTSASTSNMFMTLDIAEGKTTDLGVIRLY